MKKFLRHVKWCFLGRKHIKNWLSLILKVANGLCVAKLDRVNLLFREGTDDLSIMLGIFAFGNYCKYFPFNETAKIIDIGAQNGYFSLWAFINTKRGSRIFAYEPVSDNYEIALSNIRNNNISDIKLYNKGVSGRGGDLLLYLNEEHTGGHSGYKERVMKCAVENISEISVDCVALEDVFRENEIENCDFCKIDCEGAEFDILLNAPDNILRSVKVFSIEFHEFGGHKVDEVVNLFKKNNFHVEFSYSSSAMDIKYGMLYAKIL